MQRKASAVWKGGLRAGSGSISTASKALSETPYSFGTRFENMAGTNPEELVAAAHAACFSMALSLVLGTQKIEPAEINTSATTTIEKVGDSWQVTESHLDVVADIPNVSDEVFQRAASEAKTNCPISRLLNTKITMNAKLEKLAA